MPRYNGRTCEPFRAWTRLEARPRKYDFDQVLKAGVHDPLWFLTRQWQFGEFKGEDTGSPILAKIAVETSKISRVKVFGDNLARAYDDSLPLESRVEKIKRTVSYKERLQLGQHWMRLLDHYGNAFNDANPSRPAYNKSTYLRKLLDLFPLDVPTEDLTQPEAQIAAEAQQLTNKKLMNYLETFGSRIPDGMKVFEASGQSNFIKSIRSSGYHNSFLNNAVNDLKAWYYAQYPELEVDKDAWKESQLEYQFKASFPEKSGQNTVVIADEYASGKLDWYNFDVASGTPGAEKLTSPTTAERNNLREEQVVSFIPTEVSFPGMPNNRFWEFEDGKVDLGNINAETTDISKIVVAEFATIFGNNWYLFPYDLAIGSLAKVQGIVVTDVFGQQTFVEAAIQGDVDDWHGWGMFNLTKWDTTKASKGKADTRMLLPPSVAKVHESEAIEEILFARDEMANLVWAVETRVDDLLHAGMDGHQAAVQISNYLETLFADANSIDIAEEAVLHYVLGNSVPENWIPFINIHVPGQNRAIQLQRASMPGLLNDKRFPIRPRTGILRHGLNADNSQSEKYLVHEEEVPRAGIKVSATFQRTRWYNGKIVQWYGYKKSLGKGESGSGLQFDRMNRVSS